MKSEKEREKYMESEKEREKYIWKVRKKERSIWKVRKKERNKKRDIQIEKKRELDRIARAILIYLSICQIHGRAGGVTQIKSGT